MAHINLLPWREELRSQKQQQFAVISGGTAVAGLLLVLLTHMQMEGKIDNQNQRNAFLEKEIQVLDERITKIKDLEKTKTALLARMDVIQQLQGSRPQSVHLMDELVKTLPDGVYLDKITQSGNSLTLVGNAQSNARVSAYMRNISKSGWLHAPKLDVIETRETGNKRSAEFVLRASQKTRSKDDVEGQS